MTDQPVSTFLDALASREPVPGGGGAAALCGAMGAALAGMVSNLTLGKKKYADVQAQIQSLLTRGEALRTELTALIGEDAQAFYPLSQAYGLPKDTPGRDAILEEALDRASGVPLRVMEKALEGIEMLSELAPIGSKIAISDVGVAAQLCRAALNAGAMNVFINTRLMKDRDRAEALNRQAVELMEGGSGRADGVYALVLKTLTGRD